MISRMRRRHVQTNRLDRSTLGAGPHPRLRGQAIPAAETRIVLVALRVALFVVALVAVVTMLRAPGPGEATNGCGAVPDVITHGPRVGAVTDTSAKVWVRACQQVNVAVEYKLAAADWSVAQQTASVLSDPLADNTAVVLVSGLSPRTDYDYRLLVEGQLPSKPVTGEFRTLPAPGAESAFSFIVSSDMHHPFVPLPDTILGVMNQRDAEFAFMMGDQIVIEIVLNDLGRCCDPQSQADYELAYRDMYAYQPFRDFVANTPTLMTWDDHEIRNDWDQGTASPYPWARGAFDGYIGSANPPLRTPSGEQYIFKAGQIEFYVLDTRTYRSLGEMPDGPDKTMLGVEQKQDLKNWLLTSNARFKFIVSSVMFSDFSGHIIFGESWPAFRTERDEILNFIKDNRIPGVILFSGDEHFGRVFRMAPWDLYEIAPNPLSWKVGGPLPPDPQILFQSNFIRLFGLFSVDTTACPATLTVQLIDETDQPRYTLPLTEMDLGADRDGDGLPPCAEASLGTDPNNPDTDGDSCTDGQELGPIAMAGGQRSPINPWDYFNPTGDGLNRVDDILAVLNKYFVDAPNPSYTAATDRTFVGPNPWNLGPPNGLQRVDDVLLIRNHYFHDCA